MYQKGDERKRLKT